LYQAKDEGRNQERLYDPAQGGRELISALQRARGTIISAIENDQIVLFRQPIFAVSDPVPAMYEVLVRFESEDGEIIGPSEFIPEAEALDLIQQIDERVVELTFQRWKEYHDAGQDLRLTVNVSARSVGDYFGRFIVDYARALNVPPELIIVEITETATIRSGGHTAVFSQRLSDAGFQLAIDDFGSGTTSLKQLKSLEFGYVKLDGSLIRNLKSESADKEFVRAVAALAHGLGVQIVAEFVQDQETLDFLQECGVEYAQGYFLGKPERFPDAS
jgi:EAL domain-containing protein (putative c-di-GMP-specific phosphodiesterase class I)